MAEVSNLSGEPDKDPAASTPEVSHATGKSVRKWRWGVILACLLGLVYTAYAIYFQTDSQDTIILGQTRVGAESMLGLRVLVRHRDTLEPIEGARVRLLLRPKDPSSPPSSPTRSHPNRVTQSNSSLTATGSLQLYSTSLGAVPLPEQVEEKVQINPVELGTFRTDSHGTLTNSIQIPNIPTGEYLLVIDVKSWHGKDHVERIIAVTRDASLLLSSDKPLYQPGQTIHLRSLIRDSHSGKPLKQKTVTFEISDAKGNKVFKEEKTSSAFGITSADFTLANEINEGSYTLRAVSGPVSTERAVEVKTYVPPKISIQMTTLQNRYLPGQTVTGSVHAAYFYGKPVANSKVQLFLKATGRHSVLLGQSSGRTDASGHHGFSFRLPEAFLGMPKRGEVGTLDLTATITDVAGSKGTKTQPLAIARDPLIITATPECIPLVRQMENMIYIMTERLDGQPAHCKVWINGTLFQGNAEGVCIAKIVPGGGSTEKLKITAYDPAGNTTAIEIDPAIGSQTNGIILRTDKAIYASGEMVKASVLSSEDLKTIYLDVLQDGQTVQTLSVPMTNRHATAAIPLPRSAAGVLTIHAYAINEQGNDHGALCKVYVPSISGLKIQCRQSREVYRPGDVARMNIAVTDAQGQPVPAALGIVAVDESVLAMGPNVPPWTEADDYLQQLHSPNPGSNAPETLSLTDSRRQIKARVHLCTQMLPPIISEMESLIWDGIIDEDMLHRLHKMRGTIAYQRIRQNPAYAEMIQYVESESGIYGITEATRFSKSVATEIKRQAFLRKIGEILAILIPITLLVLPLVICATALRDSSGGSRVIACILMYAFLFFIAALILPAFAKAKASSSWQAMMGQFKQLEKAREMAAQERSSSEASVAVGDSSPRVRRDFPETLFWRPEIITDDQGRASVEMPLADSITTWHTSISAVSESAGLGSADVSVRAFQDFSVDMELPARLSLNDQVTVPVICRNYLPQPQEVLLTLSASNWFECPRTETRLRLAAGEVGVANFPIRVLQVGDQALRITAKGSGASDAIERTIRIAPTGQRIERVINETLKDGHQVTVNLPPHAIVRSQEAVLKLFPSRFSEIVEGLEGILTMPSGCFEQTSSTTYPNVLVLDYLRRTGRLAPEIQARAHRFISAGYQRLLTFEVPGGGFEWFGHTPANCSLTAYAILEFSDMARVFPVDKNVIERSRQWLFAQDHGGWWSETQGNGTWGYRLTASEFITWALAEAGDTSPELQRALEFQKRQAGNQWSPYGKALVANALLAHDRTDPVGLRLAAELYAAHQANAEGQVFWSSTGQSITYSKGRDLEVETTALAAIALMRAQQWPETVKAALTWITAQKTSLGTWGSTQATILAMRALLEATTSVPMGQQHDSTIVVRVNGQPVETVRITPSNNDVMRHLALTRHLRTGGNRVQLEQQPPGELPFQLAASYWIPGASNTPHQASTLTIGVDYGRINAPVQEPVRCNVTVQNTSSNQVDMPVVELAIPPGFDVDTDSFESLVQREVIARFEMKIDQVVLYLRALSEKAPLKFSYTMRARYPLQVQTPASVVYAYYQPENRAATTPVTLTASQGPGQ